MAEAVSPAVDQAIGDLDPGAVVTLYLPCKVRVLGIEPVQGSMHRGNREVSWEIVEPIETTGAHHIGSLVRVPVWSEDT